jgi:hypothetical protein
VPPPRSLAQREDALRRATAVRRQRAQLKRDLKTGRRALAEVLTDPPAFVLTAKVADLLLALPKYGPRCGTSRPSLHDTPGCGA